MILTVNNLAKTYKLLPSEVMERGNTFDLYVMDIATRYERYQQKKSQDRFGAAAPTPKKMPSKQELMDMLMRAKGAK
jgi:hypothetical protein